MTKLDYHHQDRWPAGFGRQQSPIALAGATTTPRGPERVSVTTPYQMRAERDDATTIKLLGAGGLRIGQQAYACVQAHFHVPCEHQVDEPAALELHLVHQNAIGQLCVVAVLFGLGAENPVIAGIQAAFAPGATVPTACDLTPLVPQHARAFHYLGSLTTPPLQEGVEWYVLEPDDLTVSAAQAAWFPAHFGANNRDLQPQAQRVVERFEWTQ